MVNQNLTDTISGSVVAFQFERKTVRFFVTDPLEEIQKYHAAGEFYELYELEIIRKYYKQNTIFVDIGANIGNHAIFAELFLNAPEVIIFEPNKKAIDHLEINLSLNSCVRINRDFLGFPVSDKMNRKMRIDLSPDNNLGNTVFGYSDEGMYKTITGDFALSKRPIGFIKIDVEEMEFDVLRGLQETIFIWRPIIFVEVLEAYYLRRSFGGS